MSASSLVAAAPAQPILPLVALGVFLAVFVGLLVWIFVVPRARWRRDASIPLDDPPKAETEPTTTTSEVNRDRP